MRFQDREKEKKKTKKKTKDLKPKANLAEQNLHQKEFCCNLKRDFGPMLIDVVAELTAKV